MPPIRFVKLSPAALQALVAGDLATASAEAGVPLSQYLADERWLWEIRLADIAKDPEAAEWIARAAADGDTVVGHGGFHGPPDADGVVEVAYSVDPAHRRRGYARAMLTALLARADADPRVTAVRASIRPDNVGSKATIAGFGFFKIGEQWDPEDGLEDVYLRSKRTTSGR
ncbi:GNAT family protein [Actinoplanes sp. NPDC023936]|uniref:GNAT family N-acetyltransferase n=1 Tax=Actinoplanes sp. NPDC023936 TaxID=3154910 RepID=UPI0033C5A4EC